MKRLTIIDIIENIESFYSGDLKHYFKAIWGSTNVNLPYHNIRHMLHVMWSAYNGLKFYEDRFDKDTRRCVLIAALFHDFNHTGKTGNDDVNIEIALRGIEHNILPEDMKYLTKIKSYISATRFPHFDIEFNVQNLPMFLLRDADVSYTLSDVWIQTVGFGLNYELGLTSEQILRGQEQFLNSVELFTDWARMEYSAKLKDRMLEANRLVKALFD